MARTPAGGVLLGGPSIKVPPSAVQAAELRAGLRCGECGQRIEEGWSYTYAHAQVVEGQPVLVLETAQVCSRPICKGVEKVRTLDPICRERISFEWLGSQ